MSPEISTRSKKFTEHVFRVYFFGRLVHLFGDLLERLLREQRLVLLAQPGEQILPLKEIN
jgi:hypothetical protein